MRFADSRTPLAAACLALCALSIACGGGSRSSSSSSSPSNTQAITVNAGPDGNYANGLFTNVTVCAPGTSNCQTINGVLVDTGSYGLRVLSSALGTLASSLPQQMSGSNPVLECAQFVSSVTWGPVKTADIQMAGEKASSVPIQVIDPSIAPVPSGCSGVGPAEETLASLGANGILGVGFFITDCGTACSASGSGNAGFYYSCAGSSCQVIAESTSQQVQDPVALFSHDRNGVVLQLPAASASAPSVSGSLIFGIGTQSDNAQGGAQIYYPDTNGNLKTAFKGSTYEGFLDSGSNAYFFLNSGGSGLPNCPSPNSGFYCPSSPANLSATNSSGTGSGGTSTIQFTIANADQLFSAGSDAVFPTLGGSNPNTFDWGLPFFYGRKVFVAFEPPAGTGPYWAY